MVKSWSTICALQWRCWVGWKSVLKGYILYHCTYYTTYTSTTGRWACPNMMSYCVEGWSYIYTRIVFGTMDSVFASHHAAYKFSRNVLLTAYVTFEPPGEAGEGRCHVKMGPPILGPPGPQILKFWGHRAQKSWGPMEPKSIPEALLEWVSMTN